MSVPALGDVLSIANNSPSVGVCTEGEVVYCDLETTHLSRDSGNYTNHISGPARKELRCERCKLPYNLHTRHISAHSLFKGPGDLWYFPPGIPHSLQATNDTEEGSEFLLV